MIKPTIERLLKLQKAIIEQANELPEYSAFGTKNDLINEQQKVELIAWCIENFDNKDALTTKFEYYEDQLDESHDFDELYERYSEQLELLDFVLGNSDSYYTLFFDEKDEVNK